MGKTYILISLLCCLQVARAQKDSIQKTAALSLKISHAEPIYMDLVRDLGARRGEKELNVGWEMNDRNRYIEHTGFVEYEFAPIDRLGLEVEIPFNYYNAERMAGNDELPNEKIEGLKFATQYTFLVSDKYNLSMAAGTICELELHSFKTVSATQKLLKGEELNPFLVIAKRWGRQFHSLIYTGPVFHHGFGDEDNGMIFQTNLSVHYQIPHSGHLLGVKINDEFAGSYRNTVIRPQLKLKLDQGFALGVVTGIPFSYKTEGLSFMLRLIYELKQKK